MLQRALIWAFCGALCASAAYSQNLGFGVAGSCVAGTCPSQGLAIGSNAALPLSLTATLTNGDTFEITGNMTSANSASGTLALTYLFQVVYVGNSTGSPSRADMLTLDMYSAYQSTFISGNFGGVLSGTFSQNIAGGSTAQICTAANCSSTANSPGNFSVSESFSEVPSGGVFPFDYTIKATFGAASPVGSYILFSYPSTPAPAIRSSQGVISASAFGAFPTIAPGSWIEIYGANLALGTRQWATVDFSGSNAPTTLGGTSVSIGGKPAFIDYVSPTQVNAQVPAGVGTGSQFVVVTTAGGSSAAYSVNVAASQPGLLAVTANGVSYVGAFTPQNVLILPPGAISGVTSQRATAGQVITLYGIGFGSVNPAFSPGQIANQLNALTSTFTVNFGSTPATVQYSGLAPNYVGLYQFNVLVPAVTASDMVPLTYSLGGVAGTQTLYIPVQ